MPTFMPSVITFFFVPLSTVSLEPTYEYQANSGVADSDRIFNFISEHLFMIPIVYLQKTAVD